MSTRVEGVAWWEKVEKMVIVDSLVSHVQNANEACVVKPRIPCDWVRIFQNKARTIYFLFPYPKKQERNWNMWKNWIPKLLGVRNAWTTSRNSCIGTVEAKQYRAQDEVSRKIRVLNAPDAFKVVLKRCRASCKIHRRYEYHSHTQHTEVTPPIHNRNGIYPILTPLILFNSKKKKISADFEIDLKIFKILQTLPLQGDLYNLLTIVWLVRKSENDNYKNNNPHACIGWV